MERGQPPLQQDHVNTMNGDLEWAPPFAGSRSGCIVRVAAVAVDCLLFVAFSTALWQGWSEILCDGAFCSSSPPA